MSIRKSSLLPIEPRGLAREIAAAYIGVGTSKFDEMCKDGRMPKPQKVDGRTLWDRRQIDLALDRLFDSDFDPYANVS